MTSDEFSHEGQDDRNNDDRKNDERRNDRVRFGPFEVDLHTRELWKFGTRIKLIGQPFEILEVLLRRPGQLVSRDELRHCLWPSDTFVDFNHGLNAAVNKLREALSDSAGEPRYIETLPRRGYRFIAVVEWLEAKPAPSSQVATLLTTAVEEKTASEPFTALPSIQSSELPETFSSASRANLGRYLMGAGFIFTILLATTLVIRLVSDSGAGASSLSAVERTRPLISIADTASPAFSPDGNRVAFYRERSSGKESGIYATTVGSDQLLQLTNHDNDCCPVWSSDGRSIAFTRVENNQYSIYLVSADGGGEQKRLAEKSMAAQMVSSQVERVSLAGDDKNLANERKVDTGDISPARGEIDWSPDGRRIAFSAASGIYLVPLDHSGVRRLTQPPGMASDWGPAFSPDGSKVMFVRVHDSDIGAPEEIWIVPVTGGEGARLLSERGRIASPPQWTFDGRSVIFSSNRTGHPALWRVSVDSPDVAVQVSEAGSPAWDPAVSRRGYRLAYERLLKSLSIWQMDISDSADKRPYLAVSSTSDTDQGPGPQFSPDGKRLAYMSDRSGTMEIWVGNRDGSNAFQLSNVGGAGTPRWSPDSQSLAFDVPTPRAVKIVVMNLHGGAPLVLTPDSFPSVCPSWSRDGKWIYFASPHTGEWQVWKISSAGGEPVQVTRHGGHAALESLDGKYLYYAKSAAPEPEVWRVPVAGGDEVAMPLIRPGTWASWQVVEGGILFVGPSLGHQAVLNFFDFAKNRTNSVALLDRVPFWLGATTDGKTVAFDQPGREQDQAMLVENFR